MSLAAAVKYLTVYNSSRNELLKLTVHDAGLQSYKNCNNVQSLRSFLLNATVLGVHITIFFQ